MAEIESVGLAYEDAQVGGRGLCLAYAWQRGYCVPALCVCTLDTEGERSLSGSGLCAASWEIESVPREPCFC
jgi:hypothetical protein